MEVRNVASKEFFDIVGNLQYQNQDILEARELGYKSVEDAYRQSEIPWARFYMVEDNSKVLATIMEQRDGVIAFYTTVDLPRKNIREFVRVVKELLDDKLICRNVFYTVNVDWHKAGAKLLKMLGFRKYKIYNRKAIWVINYGE